MAYHNNHTVSSFTYHTTPRLEARKMFDQYPIILTLTLTTNTDPNIITSIMRPDATPNTVPTTSPCRKQIAGWRSACVVN